MGIILPQRRKFMNMISGGGYRETVLLENYYYPGTDITTMLSTPFDMENQTMVVELADITLDFPQMKLLQFGTGLGSNDKTYNLYYQNGDERYTVVAAARGSDWSVNYGGAYGNVCTENLVFPPTIKIVFGLEQLAINGCVLNPDGGYKYMHWELGTSSQAYIGVLTNKKIYLGWRNADFGRYPIHVKKVSIIEACLTADEIIDYSRL